MTHTHTPPNDMPPNDTPLKNAPLRAGMAGLALLAALAACSDPGFHATSGVRVAQPGEVASCRLIENVSMQPGVYGPLLGDQGVKYARNKLLDMAAKDGANTVVFDQVDPGGDVYLLKGKAYSC